MRREVGNDNDDGNDNGIDKVAPLACEKVEGEGCEMALSANGEFEFSDIQSGVYTLVSDLNNNDDNQ